MDLKMKNFHFRFPILTLQILLIGFLITVNYVMAGEVKGKINISEFSSDKKKWQPVSDHSNAVVFITGLTEKSPPHRENFLKQKNKAFTERVLAITEGETISFPNNDDIYHNVWSLSPTKNFDLGSYKSPSSKSVLFDKPGVVKVFCNIHPEMISTILVLKNSKFYKTGKDGKFLIKDIPKGQFELRVWAEGSSPLVKKIKVEQNSSENLNFEVKRTLISVDHMNKFGKPYSSY